MKILFLVLAVWTPRVVHPVKDAATHEMLRATAKEKDRAVREEAIEALQFIEKPDNTNSVWNLPEINAETWSREDILKNLRAPDILTQEAAVRAAGEDGATNTVPALLLLLNDQDEGLRHAVCETLAVLHSESSVIAVCERLEVEESSLVRRAAVNVLLAIHNDGGRQELLRLLQHDRWQAREAAARGIEGWGDSELAEPVHPLLNDPRDAVQSAAADALGKMRNPSSEAPLLARLPAAPPTVQTHIIWALGELHSVEAVPYLVESVKGTNDAVAKASAEALGKIKDDRVIPALRHVIDEVIFQQPTTRVVALRLLRELGSRELANRMVQFVTEQIVPPPPGGSLPTYDSIEARSEALRYLAQYGERTHGEAMLRKFSDAAPADLRPLLAATLTKLLGTEYRPLPDQDCRRYSVESLGPLPFTGTPPVPEVVPQ